MRGILADKNSEGHVAAVIEVLASESWRDLWLELQLPVLTFESLGLRPEDSDLRLWQTCQKEQVLLLTINRNAKGPDSLEMVIRKHGSLRDMPVFTFANAERVLQERNYANRVAEQFLVYVIDIDAYRGAGRLYLP